MNLDHPDATHIWYNGDYVNWDDAQTHVLTHGLHYGTGIFEGVRLYETEEHPVIFRWEDHLERLYDSAHIHEIEIPYRRSELTEATKTLVKKQGVEDAYIRPIAFLGYESLGLSPVDLPVDVAIAVVPEPQYLSKESIDVKTSSWRRFTSGAIPTTAKTTGAYINSTFARREALKNGYDEALFLNQEGRVAEGTGENLFMINDDTLKTTGAPQDTLRGITQDTVIKLAQDRGYSVETDCPINRSELYTADELFFTGTATGTTPISSVDDREINGGGVGGTTREIQDEYDDLIQNQPNRYSSWFTEVRID